MSLIRRVGGSRNRGRPDRTTKVMSAHCLNGAGELELCETGSRDFPRPPLSADWESREHSLEPIGHLSLQVDAVPYFPILKIALDRFI